MKGYSTAHERALARVETLRQDYLSLHEALRQAPAGEAQRVTKGSIVAVRTRLRMYRGRARQFGIDPALFDLNPPL